jgi:hypothetical protein
MRLPCVPLAGTLTKRAAAAKLGPMRRCLGIALLVMGCLQLGFRGMQRVRVDVPAWDFASVYAAARTWMHGGDPYDLPSVVQTWREAGAFSHRDVSYFATVYPPSSLVTLMPLAALRAGPAMVLWMALCLALLAMQFAALIDMAQIRRGDGGRLLLWGAALASAPLQFGLLSGQLSMPAISLCILAFWCAGRERDGLAGALLGLACAVKPQMAAPFVMYYLVLRRLKIAGVASLVAAAIWAVAIGAMSVSHVHWVAGWSQSVAATTRLGGVNDYGWTNRFRDEIIDLKMLLIGVFHNPLALRAAVGGVTIVLLACYVGGFARRRPATSRDQLLALAALSALCLLPVYHRVYDAAIFTTALAWGLAELDGPRRGAAGAVLVAMTVFLIPFDSVKSLGSRLHRLSALGQSWWWQTLVVPHYAWGVLATAIVLLAVMACRRTDEGPERAG